MKTALIFGVSGQDGAYLAHLLLNKGYKVVGTSRDAENNRFQNLQTLGIHKQVEYVSAPLKDISSIILVLKQYQPDEIYNLSGQSSVGYSYHYPIETIESITLGTLNILEAIRILNLNTRFYNAGSGECFGDTSNELSTEETKFNPQSPYAVAKCSSYWLVKNYRDSYGLFCSSGHLFNHESPLRPSRFVTKKIVDYVRSNPQKDSKLKLGSISIQRDWGWAPEYVEAMWKMLQLNSPEDFVIATGEVHSLENFVEEAFKEVGLFYKDYIEQDLTLIRPNEIKFGGGDSTKAKEVLGWKPQKNFKEIIRKMVANELL